MNIKNIIILGMYPYPWHYKEISDTMRLMTSAFKKVNKIFLNPSIGFRRAKAEEYSFKTTWTLKEYGDVLVCTPPLETIPSSFGLGNIKDKWVLKMLNRTISSLLGPRWRQETILYLSSGGITQSYKTMETVLPRWSIFDVLDDNIGFPEIGEQEQAILKRQFSQILINATLVTAVSQYLVDRLKDNYNVTTQWLPNGLDIEKFMDNPAYKQPIDELKSLERPLFGFVGAITSWIDFELLWKIAEDLKMGTIVLVGPIIESAVPQELLGKLRSHPRVSFLGAIPYVQVPPFLHQFDVLLLPRNYEPHSLASDPLKFYEYLATGKPVVSTALPSVKRFSDVAFICESHQEFLTALGRAQKEWSTKKAIKARNAIQDMSWEKRAENMMEYFYQKI